jgi:hypothetical protein
VVFEKQVVFNPCSGHGLDKTGDTHHIYSTSDNQKSGSTVMVEDSVKPSSRRETGFRLLFVILFALIYSAAEVVLVAVVVIQFGFVLITGERNQKLLDFGATLGKFIYQILQFVTFNSEEKPFPFADWPSAGKDQ